MKTFRRALAEKNNDPAKRRWLYVPYDQLSAAVGPLSREDPHETGIVLVECPAKAARRPYHKQKLAFILANQRQFALEQATRGVAVRYEVEPKGYREAIEGVFAETGPLRMMNPAERELRLEMAPCIDAGQIECIAHEGWMTGPDLFARAFPKGPPWKMDAFYRLARKESGILMEGDAFAGGKVSFDTENRKPWKGTPPAPVFPTFSADEITSEVLALVESRYAAHPGQLDAGQLPTTAEDAERLWHFVLEHCLPHFGPFEDAMSVRSTTLFHTKISPLLNVHRLLPGRVVADVEKCEAASLASREGFIRQILGWREFMRHIHVETDGFRDIPVGNAKTAQKRCAGQQPCADDAGDGGFARWQKTQSEGAAKPHAFKATGQGEKELGGSLSSFLDAEEPVPLAYWGQESGLSCLDHVVADVWREGWTHHIPRLMILSNFATLLDLSPRALADWFWVAYVDAFDWVVEPNVMGMGTFGLGELFVTKPYVSGAAYIDRMSDYCKTCDFHPKKNCPVTSMYWAFLDRKSEKLQGNPRVAMPLRSLVKRGEDKRAADRKTAERVQLALRDGKRLLPSDFS